ncbi:MAG: OsmC family peroxiredoxin [Ignavibacteria bacterium GWF2_33_9]|nr:MAG: OsmC family peroxiredoxin [Ignavibacteria bacterium GWF2_33_9]
MKFTRKAKANWQGAGKDGKGTLSTASGILNETPYNFSMRFENEPGTNPEELVGAAHAGCFTMKLSFVLGEHGFTANNMDTEATVTFEDGKISEIHLNLSASVDGIDDAKFQELAAFAKAECPISKSLNTNITLTAKLV